MSSGSTKASEAVAEAYRRIDAHADPALFIALRPKAEAAASAPQLDDSNAAEKPLLGQTFAIKDNIDFLGLPTTAACPAFSHMPPQSAFVVERLERAGAVAVGKTNLDQFATGLVGVRSPYGVPRNALRADLIPGGSSSGSATAVGAGLVSFSLGTDTAGSGRVPAAMNGVVGLKPTLGALSASGLLPACRTLDTISIFAPSVDEAFRVYEVAFGFDPADSYSRRLPAPRYVSPPPGLRIGVPRGDQLQFFDDEAASRAFRADIDSLSKLGFTIAEFDFAPFAEVARLLYEGPWVAERYAATRSLLERDPDAVLPVTRRIIEGARAFDAVAAFEAAYKLSALRRTTESAWDAFNVMAVPTAPRLYTVAEVQADPIRTNSNLGTYTNFVNLLDLCAIAVPSGRRDDELPSSLTFIAPGGQDGLVAGVGARVHAASGVRIGATGRTPPPAPEAAIDARGNVELAVVGAHLSGLPLNGELTRLGAAFVRAARTTSDYRLFALPATSPPKPGLLRVGPSDGAPIAVELWSLSPAAFGAFVAAIPSPLGIGTLRLEDGASAKGFLVEAEAVKGAEDISRFGGWRAFLAQR